MKKTSVKTDSRTVFAIIGDTGDVAGVHLAGSNEVVPGIFVDKESAEHHLAHSKPYPYIVECIKMTVEAYKEGMKKKPLKTKKK